MHSLWEKVPNKGVLDGYSGHRLYFFTMNILLFTKYIGVYSSSYIVLFEKSSTEKKRKDSGDGARNMKMEKNKTPLRTTLTYLIFGGLWILLSDRILIFFVPHTSDFYPFMQTMKGWLYICLSAALLYVVLRQDMKSLEESEERYRMLFQSSIDAVVLSTPETGQIHAANSAACRMFGRTEEELKQVGRDGIIDLSDPRLKPAMEERARTGHFIGELTFLRRDGTKFPVEVSSSLFKNKDGQGWSSIIVRDITQRKQNEDSLRTSEALLSEAQRIGHIGHWEWTAPGKDLACSDELLRILELPQNSKSIPQNTIASMTSVEERERLIKLDKQIFADRADMDYEFHVILPSNRTLWLHQLARITYGEDGTPVRMIGIIQDITERKIIGDALRASEERYRDLVENSLSLICTHDLEGNLLSVNEAAVKTTGYSRETLLRVNLKDILGPTGEKQFADYIAEIKANGHAQGFMEVHLANGEPRVWAYNNTLRTEGMQTPIVRGSARDVTERKRAEDKLLESEERFKKAFQSGPVGLAITRAASGEYIDANDAFSKITGFSREELMGQNSLKLGITTLEQRREYTRLIGEQRFIRNREMILKHKSGEARVVLGSMEVIELNHETCVLSTAIDITERKQAEAALARSERDYRTLFENTPIGLYRTSADGALLDANPTLVKMFGYKDRKFLLGKYIVDLYVNPTDDQRFKEEIEKSNTLSNFVAEYRRQDGTTFWTEDYIHTVRDEAGAVLFYEGSLIDITERRQAEELIRQHADELEERVRERTTELVRANRTKDEFLANMSHELRTPLNSILGFSETLLEGVQGPINHRQSQAVQTIHASGSHLLDLINDILDVAKIESGKFEIQPENISVNSICQSSLVFIKQLAHKKSISVEYSPSPLSPILFADPRRLKQILVNLLNNAVKFTPENGTVRLEVREDHQAGQMRFSVTDNGIGISPENLKKLFKPFAQLDSSLSRQYEGTGLGLSLVKNLVELHGGSLAVESEPEKGSVFHFSIPIQSSTIPTVESSKSSGQVDPGETKTKHHSGAKGRILLVEDNPIGMMVTSDYLDAKGYKVIEAGNGFEAIKQAHEQKPDLILMDIQMPGMDGIETIKLLRSEPEFVHIPIIAITALAMQGDRERCLAAGATEYMSKPVSLKNLMEVMENLLQSDSQL
jgi:PAS domain S-box-containing protein